MTVSNSVCKWDSVVLGEEGVVDEQLGGVVYGVGHGERDERTPLDRLGTLHGLQGRRRQGKLLIASASGHSTI